MLGLDNILKQYQEDLDKLNHKLKVSEGRKRISGGGPRFTPAKKKRKK